jgi:predicted O-methyltransferase YrrM
MKGQAFLHFLGVLFGVDKPATQTLPGEREALIRYAAGSATVVEIGVYEGVNTVILSKAMDRNGKIFGIDPFFKGSMGICYYKIITGLNLNRNGIRKKVRLIEKLSFDAVDDIPENVDFIFIDGDHSWEGISKDWPLYANKLKPGGIMALHDTSTIEADGLWIQDSVRYYNEVIVHDDRFEWLETVERMNVLRKKMA